MFKKGDYVRVVNLDAYTSRRLDPLWPWHLRVGRVVRVKFLDRDGDLHYGTTANMYVAPSEVIRSSPPELPGHLWAAPPVVLFVLTALNLDRTPGDRTMQASVAFLADPLLQRAVAQSLAALCYAVPALAAVQILRAVSYGLYRRKERQLTLKRNMNEIEKEVMEYNLKHNIARREEEERKEDREEEMAEHRRLNENRALAEAVKAALAPMLQNGRTATAHDVAAERAIIDQALKTVRTTG